MAQFEIRAGGPFDARGVAPILAAMLGRSVDGGLIEALNTNLLRLLQTPGAAFLVAEDSQERVLGFASLWTRWGLLDDKPSGLIDRIIVHPQFLHTAVSSALLEQALGACQAMGCGLVELVLTAESTVDSKAVEGLGFRPVGARYLLEVL